MSDGAGHGHGHGSGWKAQPERASAFWIGLLLWIAHALGRRFTRLLLWPIAAFFLLTGSAARQASADYLRRVLGRPPRGVELLRHVHTFAVCLLDRFLILSGRSEDLKVRKFLPDDVRQAVRPGRGCIMLVAHVGSFEVLRHIDHDGRHIPLRILLDRSQAPQLMGLLERINPAFAGSIIDAGQRGPELVLALREALDQGYSIGIMADRVHGDEATLKVRLLGGEVSLPAGPWVLASVLRAPLVASFGIYRDGAYEARFELLSAGIEAGRAERAAVIQALAQDYAARVERRLCEAPYNWFNFYAYWSDEGGR